MAKWKELGEVPDSDDESLFDSEDSQQPELPQLPQLPPTVATDAPSNQHFDDPPPPAHAENHDGDHDHNKDIWDIPSSSQSLEDLDYLFPDDLDPSSSIPILGGWVETTEPEERIESASPLSDVEDDSATQSHEVDEATPGAKPIGEAVRATEDVEAVEAVETVETNKPAGRSSLVIELGVNTGNNNSTALRLAEDEIFAREEAARQGRSFRPRKPIQEHPYLLESAHYSSLFKSRGIRPVRVALEEAAANEGKQKDSQEEDYEEDTQSTGGGLQDTAEESQLSLQHNSLDDRDELALSSVSSRSPTPTRRLPLPDIQRSSQNDDDELPTLEDLVRRMPNGIRGRPKTLTKRLGSPKTSSKRKQLRHFRPASPPAGPRDIFDIPPSPPQTSPAVFSVTPVIGAKSSRRRTEIASITPKPSSVDISRDTTPVPIDQFRQPIDLTVDDDSDSSGSEDGVHYMAGSDAEDPDNAEASSSPERAPDLNFRRKIRGVLPASWIRLDQQLNRAPAFKPTQRHSPEASPERPQRKGIAQRRIISPKPNSINTPFFFDDDESDNDNNTNDTILRTNDPVPISHQRGEDFPIFDDDAGSVIEDDQIDHMLPSRKRVSSGSNHQRAGKRRKTQSSFSGQPGARKRQQRITGLLNRSGSGPTTSVSKRALDNNPSRKAATNVRSLRHVSPPRLSILDVMQSDAPQFVRIAARAAKRKPGKGKASPSEKQISLGTRKDNVDVHDVLRSWKRGKIQSRLPEPAPRAQERPMRNEQPLQPASSHMVSEPTRRLPKPRSQAATSRSRFSRPKVLAKQTNLDKFVDIGLDTDVEQASNLENPPPITQRSPKRKNVIHRQDSRVAARTAQLEMEEDEPLSRYAFDARKKALDALYRKTRRALPTPAYARLERVLSAASAAPVVFAPPVEVHEHDAAAVQEPVTRTRIRPRKPARPRPLDTAAARYVHANDPLPDVFETTPEPLILPENGNRLMGLGPYGTHYTQHFEVFPLDPGVFFHESTVFGDGRVVMASDKSRLGDLTQSRGHCSITLGDIVLRWGSWEAQTSSEVGLVFDLMLEQLQSSTESANNHSGTPVQATDFVLKYLQQHISFPDNDAGGMFAKRIVEVMSGFAERLGPPTEVLASTTKLLIEVLTRLLIILLQTLRICGKLKLSESPQVEEMLKKIAQQLARTLLKADLADIRNLYDDLQDSRFRERGIRNEHHCVIAWVVLIRVLQEACISRAGFWDMVAPIMLKPGFDESVDARLFEKLWHDLFTILPLGEFDNQGVAVSRIRDIKPLEGWIMPQKLLCRIFDVYKSNQRQPASFNDYCRAVVGRCHYLVEQWGWRKPHTVIGTIFDFFAGQKLAHLRNEEVDRSPQFLEDLAENPSLKLQPSDRCFHVFLKLLALAIQRLRKLGQLKDMRNLVARVLPNHDRQYLKESDVHESELAALRNHHDLLCTLFWSAPPALRPAVQAIQKLVIPSSSHTAACKINIRAWNQLTRYVVSSRIDLTVWRAFNEWQKDIFEQQLEQHKAAEAGVHQQLLQLSTDASKGVSPDIIRGVVNQNKRAATDVLDCSLSATLDVVRHALSPDVASLVINIHQLHQVFAHFSKENPDLHWGTLELAVETVDSYLSNIERFIARQNTVPREQDRAGDAVLYLDHHLSATFFSMARIVISSSISGHASEASHRGSTPVEHTVSVAGRLAAVCLRGGKTRLKRFFEPGKYGLFESLPSKLPLHSRRYLCLFFTTLIECGVTDFSDLNTTPIGVLLDAIVKPYEALSYENRLAYAVKQHGRYIKDIPVELGNTPDYNSNRDLFEHVIASLRTTLRSANHAERPSVLDASKKAVKGAMEQVRRDLASLVDTSEHANYIAFVQAIIHLIKSQGIYQVEPFFSQFSREYAPPAQDPNLQTATILGWGLKLEDSVTGAVSGLSYCLFSNFKAALLHGKLEGQVTVVQEVMKNVYIMSFMLSHMIPAIIRTAVKKAEGWVILDIYVRALEQWFEADCIHREFGEEAMGGLLALLEFVYTDIQLLQRMEVALGPERLHTLTQMTKMLNLMSPSMTAFLFNESQSSMARDLRAAIGAFTEYTRAAGEYLAGVLKTKKVGSSRGTTTDSNTETDAAVLVPVQIDPVFLFEGVQFTSSSSALGSNEHINSFSRHITEDITKSWEVSGSTLTIRGPKRPAGDISTQSAQGTPVPKWNTRRLAEGLLEELKQWNSVHDKTQRGLNRRYNMGTIDNMPF
ncbi:Mus7/MMS22 family-domain-containing protein [Apiospora arundinis]|uniref:Mus7/MMS22 family-domain-containing protein n=1 Tax=Apiospora arundinis TaxID=335852 RepID=A0ABR2IGF1_9PEZI